MLKNIFLSFSLLVLLFTSSCGTIFKSNQINKSHSSRLDITIVLLDSIGLLFFIIPGVVALTVDYLNGTLYLPKGSVALNDFSDEGIQKALVENGYNVSLEDIKLARNNTTN